MNILSLDLGKTSAFYSNTVDVGEEFEVSELVGLEKKIKELVHLFKPHIILYPAPTRFYRILRSHFQYIGIINLIAEKHDIQTIEVIDSRCKKVVIGNGHAKKEEIMEFFGEKSEHVADCMLFHKWYVMSTENS